MKAALNHIHVKATSHMDTPILETSENALVRTSFSPELGSLKTIRGTRSATMVTAVVRNMGVRHPVVMPMIPRTLKLAMVPKGIQAKWRDRKMLKILKVLSET